MDNAGTATHAELERGQGPAGDGSTVLAGLSPAAFPPRPPAARLPLVTPPPTDPPAARRMPFPRDPLSLHPVSSAGATFPLT